ncbi:D-galactonate dehydratase [Streptomyces tendae]
MKITRVETFAVPPRWLLCRVETDEGVVGWGEPMVEGRAATVRTAVRELSQNSSSDRIRCASRTTGRP